MSDAQRFWLISFFMQEGAYTSRCQMPEYAFESGVFIKWEMVRIEVTIQTCSDLKSGIVTWMCVKGGIIGME